MKERRKKGKKELREGGYSGERKGRRIENRKKEGKEKGREIQKEQNIQNYSLSGTK